MAAALLSLGLSWMFFRRRFEETAVTALSFYLLIYGVVMAGPLEAWSAYWIGDLGVATTLQAVLLAFPSVALFVLFPNGRFVPSWTRWLLLLAIPWSVSLSFLPLYDGSSIAGLPVLGGALMVLWSVSLFFAGVYAQIYRYRHVSTATERQQTKWIIYGFALWLGYVLLSTGPYYYLTSLPPDAPAPWWAAASEFGWFLALNIIPISLSIAVTRHRLWDIDLIINRTLVYGVLTAVGVGLYVLVVGAVGMIFQQSSDVVTLLLTTILIIFLFRPLRSRLQLGADKLAPVHSRQEVPIELTAVPTQPKVETAVAVAQTKSWLPLLLWAVGMALVAAGLVLLGLNWQTAVPPRWGFRGFQSLFAIPVMTGGAFIASRRPRNPIGWFILATGIVGAFVGFGEEYAAYALLTRPGLLPGGEIIAGISNWLWIFSMGLGAIYIPLYFPDGRLPSPRWRIVAWLGVLWMIMGSLRLIIEPGPLDNMRFVINPFGIEKLAAQLSWLSLYTALGIGLLVMGAAALSLILRYRRSGGEVRLQIKWVAYAAALMPLSGIVGQFDGWFADLILFLIVLAFPAATWIAILRYRLYDIDLIINRTLVYGAVTACIIAVYALVVGAIGTLFQAQGNWLIALIATGLVAALFQPLRERWQHWVNQLLYGHRDEPFEVLASLGKRLQGTMSPETIYPTIVESVAQTLKLPYVALTVKKGDTEQTVKSFGKPTAAPDAFPLTYQGVVIGQLLAAQRSPDEPFTTGEKRLLRNIARQAGTAVYTHQLAADLQRARQQIVASREEERRRLRRDLHDGLGPALASHMLKIGSARALLNRDPATTDRLLLELETSIETTLADVRRLVYNLRPPALDQWGLAGAVRAYAAECESGEMSGNRQKLAIKIDAPDRLPPLPAAVEVAAYHIAREGLTNVVRHAQAQHCTLKLAVDEGENGRLHLRISDDGQGLPDIFHAGVGLASMQERAEELGGNCVIKSSGKKGTRVTAVLPLAD